MGLPKEGKRYVFKQMLKSMFHPIVEQKENVLIDSLLKGYVGECYLHTYKIYVKRRVARGNRIISINKVIFPIFFSDI